MSQTYQHNERPGPMRNPAFHVPQEEKWLCGHGDVHAVSPPNRESWRRTPYLSRKWASRWYWPAPVIIVVTATDGS